MEISQDQLLGEGDYANVQKQSLYDDHTLAVCHTAALHAWDRTGEIGKKIESHLLKSYIGPKGNLHRFLTKNDFSNK